VVSCASWQLCATICRLLGREQPIDGAPIVGAGATPLHLLQQQGQFRGTAGAVKTAFNLSGAVWLFVR
jgi:hypothetical protein